MPEKFINGFKFEKPEEKFEESKEKVNDVLTPELIEEIYKKSKLFSTKEFKKDCKEHRNSPEKVIAKIANSMYDVVKDMIENKCTIFVPTETSGTHHAPAVKEAWRTIYDGKNIKVMPINIKGVWLLAKSEEEREKEISRLAEIYREKLEKLGIDINKDIAYLYDEAIYEELLRELHEKGAPRHAIGCAAAVLKKIGIKTVYPKISTRAGYCNLSQFYYEDYKNIKDVLWKEAVTRAIDTRACSPLRNLEEYIRLGEPGRVKPAKNIKKALAIIHDMKLIGKVIGEKIKKEITEGYEKTR
jgi:hypothetical protein